MIIFVLIFLILTLHVNGFRESAVGRVIFPSVIRTFKLLEARARGRGTFILCCEHQSIGVYVVIITLLPCYFYVIITKIRGIKEGLRENDDRSKSNDNYHNNIPIENNNNNYDDMGYSAAHQSTRRRLYNDGIRIMTT